MKKGFLFSLLVFLLYANAQSDEVAFTATQDTGVLTRSGGSIPIKKGENVFLNGEIRGTTGFNIQVRTEDGREGVINSDHFLPQGSRPLPASLTDRLWVPSFYQHFLLPGATKEIMFDYEPFWRDEYDNAQDWDGPTPWWWYAGATYFAIRDNFVIIFYTYITDIIDFATVSQRQDGDTVTLLVLCNSKTNYWPQNHLNERFSVGETYRLTVVIDRDYIDIFVNGDTEAVATLIAADDHFLRSINNFFHDDEIDMSGIIWPRRADGSTDFPPPEGVTFWADYAQEAEEPENSSSTNSVPAWALVTIISTAVLVMGGIVLFAVKLKRTKA